MNEKQLAKLIKKTTTAAAAKTSKVRPAKAYDPSLQNRSDEDDTDVERAQMFEQMRKREF